MEGGGPTRGSGRPEVGVGRPVPEEAAAPHEALDRELEVRDLVAVGAPRERAGLGRPADVLGAARAAGREEPAPGVVLALEVTGRATDPPVPRGLGRAAGEGEARGPPGPGGRGG